jgi:NADH:ubiquinone oxidoreductase subunit 5 (subunit L)/multisubunit Na+/H+ antiporter MnhA subunit
MYEDPHLPRFLSYLSLFTFFMIILVTAGNLLQLFLGWEGVGFCSYLLVNF